MTPDDPLQRLFTEEDRMLFREFIFLIFEQNERFMLHNEINILFQEFCREREQVEPNEERSLGRFVLKVQEIFIVDDHLIIMHRYAIARYRFFSARRDGSYMEQIELSDFLDLRDRYLLGHEMEQHHPTINFAPFYDFTPFIKDTRNIGRGIRFLNRYLSSSIFSDPDKWNQRIFSFLKIHNYNGKQLLINGEIHQNFDSFLSNLEEVLGEVSALPEDTPFSEFSPLLHRYGFEPGWGNTAGRVTRSIQLLFDLITEPTDELLVEFVSRLPLPLISRIAIVSPHGWFGQDHVLGKPDTGGQVIYILDQVRALEKHLTKEIELAGLMMTPRIIVLTRQIPEAEDTSCDQKLEKIHNTENCWILRIPFREEDTTVVPNWISRFHVWPYLERFAEESSSELVSELNGRPDLIIGNYSDGNLVATLLSDMLDVVQCNIAHALEKTKYLFSDLYWESMEEDYNFSKQYVADILAMNKTDFIITSTRQEIYGTPNSMGQYESYQFFTLPGLCQVESGINLYVPKFNVIPPGVDEEMYFPFSEEEKRNKSSREIWEERIFSDFEAEGTFGHLIDPSKPPIFTMARFDRIKNITGLIEAFGLSDQTRERCNLVFAAGYTDPERSGDREEKEQITLAHELINRYGLHGHVRWLPSINKIDTGEVYRIMADHNGIFVQPALFEAFGLTILEAMLTGLPTFGPLFGGPLEIIEEGRSGFLLNTSQPSLIAAGLDDFIRKWMEDEGLWKKISDGGIERVQTAFTWKNYSKQLINLAKLYGFWRYSVTGKGKIKLNHYADMIYHFLFKQRL